MGSLGKRTVGRCKFHCCSNRCVHLKLNGWKQSFFFFLAEAALHTPNKAAHTKRWSKLIRKQSWNGKCTKLKNTCSFQVPPFFLFEAYYRVSSVKLWYMKFSFIHSVCLRYAYASLFGMNAPFFFFLLPLYHSLPASQTAATLPLKKKKKRKRMKRRNGTCSYLSLLYTCSHLFIAVDGDNRVLRVDVQLLYSITLENCSFSPFWAVMQSRRTCDSAAGFLHWFSIFIACSGFLFLFLK